MDLGVGEIGFIFYSKHPLLVTRTQRSNPGPTTADNQRACKISQEAELTLAFNKFPVI